MDENAAETTRAGRTRLDRKSTEHQVSEALTSCGYAVRVQALKTRITETLREIEEEPRPDVIFNLTEQYGDDRKQDMTIAAMLELLKIPYTGGDPVTLRLCRDKALSKLVVANAGVAIPKFFTLPADGNPRFASEEMIVKSRFADASEGLTQRSIVRSLASLRRQVSRLRQLDLAPVICEQFIRGREVYVSILGTRRLHVLPPRVVNFGKRQDLGTAFCTARVKSSDKYRAQNGIRYPRAVFNPALLLRVQETAAIAYKALGLRDYGRIDLRIADDGTVFFLEANPNSDLSRASLGCVAGWSGIRYEELVMYLVESAYKRRRSSKQLSGPAALHAL